MDTHPTTLSLPDALKGAGVSYGELAESLEVAPSTAWRWCSPGYRYRSSQPTAAQLAAIGERLRLGASEVRALADWYAVRARGGL